MPQNTLMRSGFDVEAAGYTIHVWGEDERQTVNGHETSVKVDGDAHTVGLVPAGDLKRMLRQAFIAGRVSRRLDRGASAASAVGDEFLRSRPEHP